MWLALLVFGFGQACIAHAAGTLEQWRQNAARVRTLAENDVPSAYAEAKQLQTNLPADATPVDHARVLNLLSRIEIYMAHTPDAGHNARRALELATQHGDRTGQAEAYLNLSLNAVNEGKVDELINITPRSLEVLNGVDNPALLGEALLRTARMYRRIGQVDESVTMCMQAMEIARRSNDPLALTYAHQGLGISFEQSDRDEEAIDHFLQMRDQARVAGSKMREAFAITSLGGLINKMGDPQRGERYIREGVALFRIIDSPYAVGHGVFSLAVLLGTQGRHAEAMSLYDEAMALFERHPHKIGLWYTLNARSSGYQVLGDTGAALADAERAHALATEIDLPLYLIESTQRLAAVAAVRGDYQRAYRLSLQAADMTAKAAREKISARVAELAQRYESEGKRRQIEELTRRNEQQAAELKQTALQQRWLWTVLGGSLLMLGGSALFLLRLRRSHDIIRMLNASLEQRVQTRTAELRQQARYLRALIDALPWWVWLKDTKSRYLAVNQAAAESYGLQADELVGKSDLEVCPRDMAEAFLADDQEVMTSRQDKTVEELQIVAQHKVWMETFKAPVLDEDGTVLGTVGFARDISERKAVDAAREAALAEAQRLAHLRSEFLSQMSHELRTPLNGILGYAQILQRDRTLGATQRTGLSVIQQCGEHLLTLVNDTLDLAKIEAGKLELYQADILLIPFLKAIAKMISVRAELKNVEFVCETASNLPAVVRGDETRLRQALLNLLANAVKFTERGQVRLHVCCSASARLRFDVHDTGIGIHADQLETIFQPFEQASDVRYRFIGTGLGLSISRHFVRLMGGDIHVESRLGEGSTFWFEVELPVVESDGMAEETAAAERIVTGYEGGRKTVLVVDDVPENRAVIVEMLSQIGFVMHEATNGREALEKAEDLKPDLILMDAVMPDLDGMETTRRLRLLATLEKVPVIMLSACASETDGQRYLEAGMNAFLPKPISFDRLLAQVAALLQLSWMHGPEVAGQMATEPLVAPPPGEMKILRDLARKGDMQDILRRASYLEELDSRYRPFSNQLRRLARGYQSKAITNLVEQYIGKTRAP